MYARHQGIYALNFGRNRTINNGGLVSPPLTGEGQDDEILAQLRHFSLLVKERVKEN
jgi:hypothetical protein